MSTSTKLVVWSSVSCIATLESEDMERGQHEFLYTKYNTSRIKKDQEKFFPSPKKNSMLWTEKKERK